MHTITAREARKSLSSLLTEAEQGQVISITRRGNEVARLVPPGVDGIHFPDITEFRNSIMVNGKPTSEVVLDIRNEERY
ncbi:MAG: type II toxin-antitoxin system prevent-host-death family antitoxin [Spirochaetales bacterium]|nr:type II toxin-antitoxin system prevent-host-death family antitoxin [Spirochaetales bacterium]